MHGQQFTDICIYDCYSLIIKSKNNSNFGMQTVGIQRSEALS